MARESVWEFFTVVGDDRLDGIPGVGGLRATLLNRAKEYYERFEENGPPDLRQKTELARILTVLAEQQDIAGERRAAESNLTAAIELHEDTLRGHREREIDSCPGARSSRACGCWASPTNAADAFWRTAERPRPPTGTPRRPVV